jgi:hypothetical protein
MPVSPPRGGALLSLTGALPLSSLLFDWLSTLGAVVEGVVAYLEDPSVGFDREGVGVTGVELPEGTTACRNAHFLFVHMGPNLQGVLAFQLAWPSVLEEAASLRSLTGLHGVGAALDVLTTSCLEGTTAPQGWNVAAPGLKVVVPGLKVDASGLKAGALERTAANAAKSGVAPVAVGGAEVSAANRASRALFLTFDLSSGGNFTCSWIWWFKRCTLKNH